MSGLHLHDFSINLSQLPRAKSYASEGRAFVSSWNRASLEAQAFQYHMHATQALAEYGFGTPVLKPRATESCKAHSEITKQRVSNSPMIRDRVDVVFQRKENKRKRTSTTTTAGVPLSRSRQRVVKAKKNSDVHLGSEQFNRLKERRERRRAKHAAIKPVEVDSEPESEGTNKKAKQRKRKKEKKKVPAGFALMHGFSANNVASGRLTMKCPGVGVFNKGKASAKSRVDHRKLPKVKGGRNRSFSETAFLMGTCSERNPRQTKALLPSSASDTDHSAPDRDPSPRLNTETFCPESYHGTSFGASDISPDWSSIVREPVQLLRNIEARAESIIWDIELDDAPLPPQAHLDSGETYMILDTRRFSWAGQKTGNCVASGRDSCADSEPRVSTCSLEVPDAGNDQQIQSGPSLGPSQSASQYVLSEPLVDAQPQSLTLSKYFVTNRNRPRSPAKTLEVSAPPQPKAGRSSSAILFHNTVPMLETIDKFDQKPTPLSLETPSLWTSEEARIKCNSHVEIDKGDRDARLVRGEFWETGTDSLSWAYMNNRNQFQSRGGEEATLNRDFINDDDGSSQTNGEAFLRYSESFNGTQSDLDCLDPGYLAHNAVCPEAFGQCPGVWDFEYEASEEAYHYTSLGEDLGYLELSSEGNYLDQPYNEPPGLALDSGSDCFSEAGYGTKDEVCDDEYSLIYATSQFLQGRRLLLDYMHNEQYLAPSQVKGRGRVSLVEADVAKSLRNHWVPQRL